jgi:hypothetical protein
MKQSMNYTLFNTTLAKASMTQVVSGTNLVVEFTINGRLEVGELIPIEKNQHHAECTGIIIGISGNQLPLELLVATETGVGIAVVDGGWRPLSLQSIDEWSELVEDTPLEFDAFLNVPLKKLADYVIATPELFDQPLEACQAFGKLLNESEWLDHQVEEVNDSINQENQSIDDHSPLSKCEKTMVKHSGGFYRQTQPYTAYPPMGYPQPGYSQQPPMGYPQPSPQWPQPGYGQQPPMGYPQQPPQSPQPGFRKYPGQQQGQPTAPQPPKTDHNDSESDD